MEEYQIAEITTPYNFSIKLDGKYYTTIYNKHVNQYGTSNAKNIHDNITATFQEATIQLHSVNMNNNMLLVGKVQSGKTSNLELFTALAFDNGFNVVIIYGGYDNTLLNQTMSRFRKSFDIPHETNYSNDKPVVFSSDDSAQLLAVTDEIIEDLLAENKPIFIISMKRPAAMKKVNALLSRINKDNIKAFIIDDEGDQASLNTKKDKKTTESATYAEIVTMKRHLDNPLYLSVTATPQALIFLDEYSELRPDSIRLIEPGDGYCGAETYHLYDSDLIEIINDTDQDEITDGYMVDSLKKALQHYILASAIMLNRGIKSSEMIIHSHRAVNDHKKIYETVNAYVDSFKMTIQNNDYDNLNSYKKEFYNTFTNLFNTQVQNSTNFENLWTVICSDIAKRIGLVLKNSMGQITQANESLTRYKIYIGGDLLQRGVTFPHLVTTYFSRWAKDSGNMDTNLQRARWFGYRKDWIDICKIFTSENIAREFTNLAEIESDLWEQFNAIQSGTMAIDEIIIRAQNTKQKPTRRNVASYTTIQFHHSWIKQRVGIFDKNQINTNNKLIEKLLSSSEFKETSIGRTDNNISAKYAIFERQSLSELIHQMQIIFDLSPFERKPLIDLIESSDDIPVIYMNDNNGQGRQRSFYKNNNIYALQQGADKTDKNKQTYRGDSHVIIDSTKINIQIHKIVPKKKDSSGFEQILTDYTQYMFAIYLPNEKKYFVKG